MKWPYNLTSDHKEDYLKTYINIMRYLKTTFIK